MSAKRGYWSKIRSKRWGIGPKLVVLTDVETGELLEVIQVKRLSNSEFNTLSDRALKSGMHLQIEIDPLVEEDASGLAQILSGHEVAE